MSIRFIGVALTFSFLWISTPPSVLAEEDSVVICSDLTSQKQLLQCVLSQHPDIKKAQNAFQQSKFLDQAARQRPNPELESRAVFGNALGDGVNETEVSLLHVFELGGKRSSRIQKAAAEQEVASVEVVRSQTDVYIDAALALYRIRQVHTELQIVQQGLSTFEQVLKNFRSRPKLAPDYEVSLGIFEIAQADYEIKQAALKGEERALQRFLELAVGQKFDLKPSLLPMKRTHWPTFDFKSDSDTWKGPQLLSVKAELSLAQSELELAKSEAWPNLRIGPAFKAQKSGSQSYSEYGLGLSLPLPFYQQNNGGRAYALQGVLRAEANVALTQQKLIAERDIQFQKYQAALQSLSRSFSKESLQKKRQKAELLFGRGVVSGQLIIENQRQILDFTKNQNEQELAAIAALARIYAIEGRLFKEEL